MRVSEQWLKQWVEPNLSTEQLSDRLTMLGLEVDKVEPVSGEFSGVVVALIAHAEKHPDADRLNVCKVDIGDGELVDVVCGGTNVRQGLKVAFAQVGAVLPGDFKIKKAKLRGVPSNGMICSEKELGLGDGEAGCIMELPSDAPLGKSIEQYLALDDCVFDIELTPNRGDCLSIRGIARDVAADMDLPFSEPEVQLQANSVDDEVKVHLDAPERCSHYVGRVIRGVNNEITTPVWMQEALRRAGLRSIHFLVDVTNFVMLEWGQPMHAFDLNKLSGDIHVRMANKDEKLTLLDEQKITLDTESLVIADDKQALALAGVMGGQSSAVETTTKDIFLESAYFSPAALMLTARRFGLQTDSSYRFERGVDYQLQRKAVERASELIVQLAGGELGPVTEALADAHIPTATVVELQRGTFERLVGICLSDDQVTSILQRLGMVVEDAENGWTVTVPSYRSDITMEADLVEELTRIYGYNNIPSHTGQMPAELSELVETHYGQHQWAEAMVGLHYHQAMNYPFISEEAQSLFDGDKPLHLSNPMASDMAVMRTSLLPGLINNAEHNLKRQQDTVRLFEYGACFQLQADKSVKQDQRLAAILAGCVEPLQWGKDKRSVDFYDIKGDVEALLANWDVSFECAELEYLHPGRSVKVIVEGKVVGCVGQLHPELQKRHGLKTEVYIMELVVSDLADTKLAEFKTISKFPEMKRDLAIIVPEQVPAKEIVETIHAVGGDILKNCAIFDMYKGGSVIEGSKSVALELVFQDSDRTLVDEDVNSVIHNIVNELQSIFNAQLRA
ncbi:MAG: phenylalanine--tRNA ligase subunit beta [Coxiellaceae bacterium]|nr:phenylalanine--tRNA ligase subunit beta [Coxiellaceae bacterium]